METTTATPSAFLRMPQVMKKVGLSKSIIYSRISEGTFPPPVSLGGRAVAWVDSEIQAWIEARIAAARDQIPNPTLATEGGHV